MRMRKEVFILSIDDILPNRFQPRIKFNEEAILELSESIKKHGVIQPIIVRKIADKYEIIAGERRYKASVLAGRTTIPAIVTDVDDKESAEIALIENVQRQDMTPIEEAISYKKILDMGYLNQSDLAIKLGKTQSTVANKLRLLNLAEEVQEALLEEKISERHARSLLKLDKNNQIDVLNKIIKERLTVRKTDQVISELLNKNQPKKEENTKEIEVLDFGLEEGNNSVNNNINNEFNIPTQPIVEPQPINNVQPQESIQNSQINPGFMDIDKIQDQAKDINFNLNKNDVVEQQVVEPFNPFGTSTVNTGQEETTQYGQINETELTPAEQQYGNFEVTQPVNNVQQPMNVQSQPMVDTIIETPIVEPQPVNNVQSQPVQEINNNVNAQNETGRFFNIFNQPQEIQSNNEQNIFNQQRPQSIENHIQSEQPIMATQSMPSNESVNNIQQPIVDIQNVEPMEEKPFNPFGMPITETTPIAQINTFSLTDDQEFTPQDTPVVESINYDTLPEEKELTPVMQTEAPVEQATVDFRTVINTIRNCIETIENYGYVIDSEELDFENNYQVTIKIDKK